MRVINILFSFILFFYSGIFIQLCIFKKNDGFKNGNIVYALKEWGILFGN